MTDAASPAKRSPGRPRKPAARPVAHPAAEPEHVSVEVAPAVEEKSEPLRHHSNDPRIGENIEDVRVKFVTFADGSEYRCDNGVVVERVN